MSTTNTKGSLNKLKKAELLDEYINLKVKNDQQANTLKQVRTRKDELINEVIQLHESHTALLEAHKELDNDNERLIKTINEIKAIIVKNYKIDELKNKVSLYWIGLMTHIKTLREIIKLILDR